MSEPMIVDTDPLFKRGDVAVWCLADIPAGTWRFAAAASTAAALRLAVAFPDRQQSEYDRRAPSAMAAVLWEHLQPRRPVPRGQASMTAGRWGQHRDSYGVCSVCDADDSMWCDTVAHGRARVAEFLTRSGVPSPRDRRPSTVIRGEMNGLKHGPGGSGGRGPCDADCRKCALEAELAFSLEAERALGSWVETPLEPTQPFRVAAVLAMGASNGEHVIRRSTSAQTRAAWSAELRAKVKASEGADRERERKRVLVDLYFEPWE